MATLRESKPDEVVDYDTKKQRFLLQKTDSLKTSLRLCENIAVAAHNAADYVPNLSYDQKFWKEDVIPNLSKSLTQTDKAHSVISWSFASLRRLAVVIQRESERAKYFSGTMVADKVEKLSIAYQLNDLKVFIKEATATENSGIIALVKQTTQLFNIIGPEAANFVDKKSEIEFELNNLYDNQKNLYSELGEKQGELTRYGHLISATQEHLYGEKQDMEDNKRRIDERNQLNAKIERTIQDIPASKTISVTTHGNSGWWFWKRNSTTSYEQVENANRQSDREYYESIIIAREARVRDNQYDAESKERVAKDLTECLSDYKGKYDKAKKDLEILNSSLGKKIAELQTEIDILHQKRKDVDKSQADIEGQIGVRGNTLIQFLIEVRTYDRTIKQGTSAYFPLVSILNGIKAMVENDIELLLGSRSDVLLCESRLKKLVVFLADYSTHNDQALEPSSEFDSLVNKK